MKEEYRTKDGRTFDNYQAYVAAKRSLNKQVLQELGLDKPLIAKKTTTGQTRPTKRRAAAPSGSTAKEGSTKNPVRRSKRVKGEAAAAIQNVALPQELSFEAAALPRKKRRVAEIQLTAQERQSLRTSEKWLDALQTYLVEEEQLSEQNLRSVMRQVEKLVSGMGVTYRHWDEGVVFGRQQKVTLRDDFDALHAEAVEFENRHGRDLGNGWLLRHPITKLARYQLYLGQKEK